MRTSTILEESMVTRQRRRRHMLEQLGLVYRGGPLWPGDTLSHQLAKGCSKRGWIMRNAAGNWITTKRGRAVYWLLYPWTKK